MSIFFFIFRYCINSCSLEFLPETEVDGSVKIEETEEIHHPATLGGCGADGICKLPPKTTTKTTTNGNEVRARQ